PLDLDLPRRNESCMALDERHVLHAANPLLEPFHRLAHHAVLAPPYRAHVHLDRFRRKSVVAAAAREVRGARARDQGLGRDAAVVDAGAAEALALDERGLQAFPVEARAERRPGLAGTDDD